MDAIACIHSAMHGQPTQYNAMHNQLSTMQICLEDVTKVKIPQDILSGEAQNLKDREIIEFIGDNP